MLKLLRLINGHYQIRNSIADVKQTIDNFPELYETMEEFGASKSEVDAAISDMTEKGTNCADFGINVSTGRRGFIFSEVRDLSTV